MLFTILNIISSWAIPFLLVIPFNGYLKKVPVYETLLRARRKGSITAVKIIPF